MLSKWLIYFLARNGGGSGGGKYSDEFVKDLLSRRLNNRFDVDVTRIGDYAVSYCYNLKSIYANECEYVGLYAFRDCSMVQYVELKKCTVINRGAFTNCFALSEVHIGNDSDTAVGINLEAFTNCYSLMELYLPYDGVCVLGNKNAFTNTPMTSTQYTGSYGKIYVPANLVNDYKSATNWSVYADRIYGI